MDLGTRYLGLALRNPVVASASPLAANVGSLRQLEDAGAGAVVLPSLFEEQIREQERLLEQLTGIGARTSATRRRPAGRRRRSCPACR